MDKKLQIAIILLTIVVTQYMNCKVWDRTTFFEVRQIVFEEYHEELNKRNIDPELFVGPELDISDMELLIFNWYSRDYATDSLMIVIAVDSDVPPFTDIQIRFIGNW